MAHFDDQISMGITGSLKEWLIQTKLDQDLAFRFMFEKMVSHYADQYKRAKKIDPLGAVGGIYSLIDEEIEKMPADLKSKIQCKKGCSYCCHIPVTITKAEAAYIGYYCKKHNIQINKKYLKKQLSIAEESIATSGISACVFLKNKTCSIYPARPCNCRKYLVYSNPIICNTKIGQSRPVAYFDYNIDACISGLFSFSEYGRMPAMLLPYSK